MTDARIRIVRMIGCDVGVAFRMFTFANGFAAG